MAAGIIARDVEKQLSDEEFIVSKTDLKSRIVYVNRTFMQISGFSESELLTQPHNMIRHPDMPKGVFQMLWQTIKAGDEFFGYVKNLCKDGSYYWVLAHVTPDVDSDGRVSTYYSVRRKPTRKAVAAVEDLYHRMRKVEAGCAQDEACRRSRQLLTDELDQQDISYFQFVHALNREEA